jgi:hypothetical protein
MKEFTVPKEVEKEKMLTTTKAMKILRDKGVGKITRATLISWIEKYDLGIKIGGSWRLNEVKFQRFLKKGTHSCEEK